MNKPTSPTAPATPGADEAAKPANFLRNVIERDLEAHTYAGRHWGGSPGDAAHHAAGPVDPARVRLRFPPEPNGYLHIGHAKSICLNFGLARDFGGYCHLRFDDTNPEKEEQEYVDAIEAGVRWLGFDWQTPQGPNLYFASSYFDFMYRAAETLIEAGDAYVDEQTADEMRHNRGDFNTPGTPSPFRARGPADNLLRFREMRDGVHADGAMVLRAKIDLASPNINLRDPTLYRIRRAHHHATGDRWCIYPMYTFAHPIEDALERVTHSVCTLEFEDQRPFYDWLLEHLARHGLLAHPLPRQYEFARLNLTYVVTSKRKLRQLVEEGHVDGWDDPRMPTIAGLRRRGYTPGSVQLLAERTGATKHNTWIDYAWLDIALRDDLEPRAPRAMAVLEPLKLKLRNWADVFGAATQREPCTAPVHPHDPARGTRAFDLGPEVWIERDDFMEVPAKGYQRLFPGNKVRLKYGVIVECTGCEKDATGRIVAVLADVVPDTRSGTPGADAVKVKGTITWVAVHDAVAVTFNLYDRLFTAAQPGAGEADFIAELNPQSRRVAHGVAEPSAGGRPGEWHVQFERHGYFVTDTVEHRAGEPVFNRVTTLKDSWAPPKA
ncbi:MAG TPA: glutamine--tRNA ligase/YqeY domain fusion protein [Burkholderiaceae bacterium]|jgi:glutaminyl-tRNA synthetase|nr:glutamine--tRNA ligase/YqeY domain fusion protein [Burkholderiaceae bacterium]